MAYTAGRPPRRRRAADGALALGRTAGAHLDTRRTPPVPLPGRYDRDMDDNSRQSAPSTTFWLWVTALNLLAVVAVLWLAG